ncbi:FAD-dependent oxidoreductase [Streptomyces sp. NPDC005281]|uniref:FAD-dependent oxidoreductase n=1 Tax=Streptomyces sp. NPDC005281 TaxID=3155712 RepID=UPI0033B95603
MIEEADVVVVGAGMFGSAAAKYASRAGADVLVIGPVHHPTRGRRARSAAAVDVLADDPEALFQHSRTLTNSTTSPHQ